MWTRFAASWPEKSDSFWGESSEMTWLPGMDSNHDSRLQRPLSYH